MAWHPSPRTEFIAPLWAHLPGWATQIAPLATLGQKFPHKACFPFFLSNHSDCYQALSHRRGIRGHSNNNSSCSSSNSRQVSCSGLALMGTYFQWQGLENFSQSPLGTKVMNCRLLEVKITKSLPRQHSTKKLCAIMELFCVCTIHHGRHESRVAIEHLRCG